MGLLVALIAPLGCYQGLDHRNASGDDPFAADDGWGVDSDDTGDGDGGDDADGEPAQDGVDEECPGTQAGPTGLRRLTRSAYNNAVHELLGDITAPADAFEADGLVAETFAGNREAVPSDLTVENYQRAAETLASAAVPQLATLAACDPDAEGAETCAGALIDRFGRRAWRRSLTDAEQERLLSLWETGDDFETGGALVLQALLQSPYFLYLYEVGEPTEDDAEAVPLTQFELATRLSMLLWDSIPDDALLDAAESGALQTVEGIEAQVERMMDDPRAAASVNSFQAQWLGLADLPTLGDLQKDALVFPSWSDTLRAAMVTENALLVDTIVRGGGTVDELLTTPLGFVNEELATHYGLDLAEATVGAPQVEGLPEGFVAVLHDALLRPGLLTRAGTMALLSKPNGTGPVHRGAFVRERVLCQPLAAPPAGVGEPPEPDPNAPRREQYEQHSSDPACSGCHELTDPIGFGLEHYDGSGALQMTLANGEPIDVTAVLTSTDVDGPFEGAAGLTERLEQSALVRQCVAKTWFRYAFAAEESPSDACTIKALAQQLDDGKSIRELLTSLATSEAFRYRASH
ncbi:MAG: DUF1592 domain-containing protein [Myxococcota bacterium]